MNHFDAQPRAQWSSYSNYVLVTTGAVVGLGNLFYFPLLVLNYGGLFVLAYIASELFLSIPLLFAELMIGRRGKQNPVGSLSIVAMESHRNNAWRLIGWISFFILFLTLSYYIVAAAISLDYFFGTARNFFSSVLFGYEKIAVMPKFSFVEVELLFFLFMTMLVVGRGINRGLEGLSKFTVPAYYLILLGLAIFVGVKDGEFLASVANLFYIPQGEPVWPIIFAALTFAFFKLNVGMGSMIVYGSYQPYSVPLVQSTFVIVFLDIVASLLAYFIICPMMLQSDIPLTHLTYEKMVAIFSASPLGDFVTILFFLAAVLAAWTPTIAMAESAVLTLHERFHISRLMATGIISCGIILLGSIVAMSYTFLSHVSVFEQWSIAEFVKNLASDLATPIAALLTAVFCGWYVSRDILKSELTFNRVFLKVWRFSIRYVAPICIVMIFLLTGFN